MQLNYIIQDIYKGLINVNAEILFSTYKKTLITAHLDAVLGL